MDCRERRCTAGNSDRGLKRAWKGVAGAALRLHHYRFVRTRMLQDALASVRDELGGGASDGGRRN